MESDFVTEACRMLEKSWNKLDIKYAESAFAEDIIFTSQFVFSSLEGKEALSHYFKNKFDAIRKEQEKGLMSVRAELAFHPSLNQPCIVLSQTVKNELRQLSIFIKTEKDKIKSIVVCAIPSAEEAILSGEIPT